MRNIIPLMKKGKRWATDRFLHTRASYLVSLEKRPKHLSTLLVVDGSKGSRLVFTPAPSWCFFPVKSERDFRPTFVLHRLIRLQSNRNNFALIIIFSVFTSCEISKAEVLCDQIYSSDHLLYFQTRKEEKQRQIDRNTLIAVCRLRSWPHLKSFLTLPII